MKRPSRTALLIGANVASLALVLAATLSSRPVAEEVVVTPPVRISLPAIPVAPIFSSIPWALIRDRTVFQADRSWVPPPPPEPNFPRPDYLLASALILPEGKSVAFVKSVTGSDTIKVHVHDPLDGWTVTAIEPKRVLLKQGHQVCELLPKAAPIVTMADAASTLSLVTVAADGHRVLGVKGTRTARRSSGVGGPHAVEQPKLRLMRPQ